jgi:hypothetical protein
LLLQFPVWPWSNGSCRVILVKHTHKGGKLGDGGSYCFTKNPSLDWGHPDHGEPWWIQRSQLRVTSSDFSLAASGS